MQDPHAGGRSGALLIGGCVIAAGSLAAYLWITRDVGPKAGGDGPAVPTAPSLGVVKSVKEEEREAPKAAAPPAPAAGESPAALLLRATELKEKGNATLKEKGGESDAATLYATALEVAETGIKSAKEAGGNEATAKDLETLRLACLLNKAMAELKLGRWKEVVSGCTRAIDLGGQSTKALYRRATALINLDDLDGAVNDLRTANKAVKGSDSLVAQRLAKVCTTIADKYVHEGNLDLAKENYEEAAAIAKAQKMYDVEYHARMAVGTMYRKVGADAQASAFFARSAEAAGAIAATETDGVWDGVTRGDALINRLIAMDQTCSALLASGQSEACRSMCEATLEYAIALETRGEWAADNARGRLAVLLEMKSSSAVRLGQWREAETGYTRMLEMAKELSDGWVMSDGLEQQSTVGLSKLSLVIDALTMMAFTTEMLQNATKAKELFAEALGMAVGAKDERREGDVRNGLGTLYTRTGEPDAAIEQLKLAIELGKKTNHKGVVGAATGNLGKAYMMQRKAAEAVECFREAHGMRIVSEDHRGTCSQLINLGGALHVLNNDAAEAEKYFTQALELADAKGLVEMQGNALRSLSNLTSEPTKEGGQASPELLKKASAHRERLATILESQGRGQANKCPVTLEEFEQDDWVVVLECYHMVKGPAWQSWVAKKHEDGEQVLCPVCRHKVELF